MSAEKSTERLVRNTFYALLLLFLIWIFAIPEFPTLDGPLHLYYAHVLGRLLSGDQHFQQYYQIRHYLPPYSTHIYLFLALESLLPLALVTKTMVAICFVLNTVGLRFLIRSLSQRDTVFSLFGLPLGLSWALFMGFFPYLLGVGLALFTAGLWCRLLARRSKLHQIAFLFLIGLLVLTHPLALLLVMIFCTMELAARYVRLRTKTTLRIFLPDLSLLLASALLCCYVLLFMGYAPGLNESSSRWPVTVANVLSAEFVTPFIGLNSYILRFALVLLLLFLLQCSLFGILQRLRQRNWDASDVLFLLGVLLLLSLPVLPFRVNGATFFCQRLVFIAWLTFSSTAGTHLDSAPRTTRWLCTLAIGLSLLTLGLAHSRVMSIAREVSDVPQLEPNPNRAGVLFAPFPDPPENQLWMDPFLLSGVKIFMQSDAALLNAPWLLSPAGPLMAKENVFTNEQIGHPSALARTFAQSLDLRDILMNESDLAVISGYKSGLENRNRFLKELLSSRDWDCQQHLSYVTCIKAERH